MAYAYRQQTRFCPTIETASVRFPKKIQYASGCPLPYPQSMARGAKNCPAPDGCALGAMTEVSIDSNAVVTLTSTYNMLGTDCFQFKVSNLITNTSYSFRMKPASNYSTGAGAFGGLCAISVSPIINENVCSTCNLIYTSLLPSPPFNVNTTTNNVTWNAPIIPENYGAQTILSYTLSGGATYLITNPSVTIVGNQVSLSITSPVGQKTYIYATNMAGAGPYSIPG